MANKQQRMNPSEALWAILEARAAENGVHPDDYLDAVLSSTLTGSAKATQFLESPDIAPAGQLLRASQVDLRLKIASLGVAVDVVGIRLGAADKAGKQTAPWTRDFAGCDIGEIDTELLWASSRGWWAVATRANFLIAYRVGHPLALFGGILWSPKDTASKRRYAVDGYLISNGNRIDPVTAGNLGAASALEIQLEKLVFAHRLVMSASASNPVAYIS